MVIDKKTILKEIDAKYPFLIQSVESSMSIEEILNMIETQHFPASSDFQGFFVVYFGEKGYKLIHNSSLIQLSHLKRLEFLTDDILKNISNYNILNDLLQVDLNDIYLVFKVYFDQQDKEKLLAVGHILKKNINTRLLMLDQKQKQKLFQ